LILTVGRRRANRRINSLIHEQHELIKAIHEMLQEQNRLTKNIDKMLRQGNNSLE
jgi:NAD-dependent SIR2 family protein deacetylase